MAHERKVVLYIVQSLDGYIARPDGDISWLSAVERPGEDYGYQAFVDTVDTVIMGRKTYDMVLSFGIDFPHRGRKCYVLTRSRSGHDENVEYYSGDVAELVTRLKAAEGGNVFVDGGAEAVRALLRHGLIDEYVISIIPVLLGQGIRLFQDMDREQELQLVGCQAYESGLVQVRYEMIRTV